MTTAQDNSKPRLLNFFVCDDVRVEEQGKLTIVGHYGRAIRIGALPALLPKLCFVAQFNANFGPGTKMKITLLTPGGNAMLANAEVQLAEPPATAALIPADYRVSQVFFQIIPMPLNEEGAFRVDFDVSEMPSMHTSFYVAADPGLGKAP